MYIQQTMINCLNYILSNQALTEDLILTSVYGPAHNTGYITNLASRHKTWPAQ